MDRQEVPNGGDGVSTELSGKHPRAASAVFWALVDALLCALAIELSLRYCRAASGHAALWGNFVGVPPAVALLGLLRSGRGAFSWRAPEVFTLLAAATAAFALAATPARPDALALALAWLLTLLFLFGARLPRGARFAKRAGTGELPVVILGTPESARAVYRALAQAQTRPRVENFSVAVPAVFAGTAEPWPDAKPQILLKMRQVKSFAAGGGIQHGIVALPQQCDAKTQELFEESARIFKHLFVAPQIADGEMALAALADNGGRLSLHVGPSLALQADGWKRVFDLVAAGLLALAALPFTLLVALAIRLSSPGPVVYKQIRIGRGNRAFTALKFRTMYTNAAERLNDYLATDEALRREWECVHKLKNDPRVTPVGRFLRRFSLDELPQLWNVMAGDMSLVGPRPIVISEIGRYGSHYAAYERVRPGLTGLWQVSGRNNTTYKERVGYDSYYVQNRSLKMDARILARTFRAVLSGAGAY